MTYCYFTRPMSVAGRYTSQPKYRGTVSSEASLTEITERSGLTRQQVETALLHLGQYVVDKTIDCYQLAPILDYLGFQATSGGSFDSPDFAPNYTNMAIDFRLKIGKTAHRRAEDRFSAENLGHNSRVEPVVIGVTNMGNGQPNGYTPGACLQIDLKDGRGELDPTVTTQGVYLTAANGTRTRCSQYGYTKGNLIIAVVPAGLTGQQTLSISMVMNGGVRTGIYSTPLSLMTSQEAAPPASRAKRAARATPRNGKGAPKGMALPG